LLYAYLQQGRYNQAEQLLNLMKKVMSESTYDNKLRPDYYENNYANMAAAFVVETERWNLATSLFPTEPKAVTPGQPQGTAMGGSHGGHGGGGGPTVDAAATVRTSRASAILPVFVRGLAAAVISSSSTASIDGSGGIRDMEIAALRASMQKDHGKAINLMKKATALEEQMTPPYGPPTLVKPTHELFGEILLRAGKPAEAAAQFKTALLRQPNRARSLLGSARAAAQSGNHAAAAAAYTALLEQWKQADEGLAELSEARDYLKKEKITKQ
jgi:tetratricopeptide (TPR) repeat protein